MEPSPLPLHAQSELIVPAYVTLRQDEIHWSWSHPETGEGARVRENCDGVLGEFTELAQVEDDAVGRQEVLSFARKYGPLYLCQHGSPLPHQARWVGDQLLRTDWLYHQPAPAPQSVTHAVRLGHLMSALDRDYAEREEGCCPSGSEAVSTWLQWARRVAGVFDTSNKAKAGSYLKREDLNFLVGEGQRSTPSRDGGLYDQFRRGRFFRPAQAPEPGQAEKEELVRSLLAELIHSAGLRLSVRFGEGGRDEVRVIVDGVGVFSRIVLAVIHGLYDRKTTICHECQTVFKPEGRKRPAGQRHYCSDECRATRSKHSRS